VLTVRLPPTCSRSTSHSLLVGGGLLLHASCVVFLDLPAPCRFVLDGGDRFFAILPAWRLTDVCAWWQPLLLNIPTWGSATSRSISVVLHDGMREIEESEENCVVRSSWPRGIRISSGCGTKRYR
jgi:hypothetical protein